MPAGGYSQAITSGPAWAVGKTTNFGDIIGRREFDIQSLTVTRSASSISFALRTLFPGADPTGAQSADIFIDTHTPTALDGWNYAIALGSGYTRDGAAAGLYALTGPSDYKTSNQVWASQGGYGIGGLIQLCSPGNNSCASPAMAWNGVAVEPATLLNASGAATKIGDVSVSRSTPDAAGYFTLTATVTNADMSIFDNFDLLAASADCANDTLWGAVSTVPTPASLSLVGFGLLALAVRRQRRRLVQ
jgi:hypothetical protein